MYVPICLLTLPTTLELVDQVVYKIFSFHRYVQKWKMEHEIRATDKLKYLSNPYNKYHLIKKLTLDWQSINDKMKQNNASGN